MRAPLHVLAPIVMIAASAFSQSSTTVPNLPFGQVLTYSSRTHFNPVGASARAIGMGGAFIAVADDATAASFNPAGLAQLEYPEFSVVLRNSRTTADYLDFRSSDHPAPLALTNSYDSFGHLNLDFVSLTLPFEVSDHNITAQLSYQDLVDLYYLSSRQFDEIEAGEPPDSHLSQSISQHGGFHTISFSIAAQLSNRLMVGWTLNRWLGDWTLDGTFDETPFQPPSVTDYLSFHQSNRFRGWSHNLGLMLRYPHARIGAIVRAPFQADYSFRTQTSTNVEDSNLPSGRSVAQIHWPLSVGAGILVQPGDRLSFAVDLTRTWWQDASVVDPRDPAAAVNFFDLNQETTTRSTTQLRTGAEYIFEVGSLLLPVRAGAFIDPPPSGDNGTGDRQSFRGATAGFGVKRGPVQVDIAAEYREDTTRVRQFLEPDSIAVGAESNGATGSVRIKDVRLYLSAIYRFQNRVAFQDLFRRIFLGPAGD